MRKTQITWGIILGVALMSCTNAEQKQTEQEDLTPTVVEDSIELADIKTESKPTFQYFDDYFAISSKTDLYATFDSSALKDEISWYAEGTVQRQSTFLIHPKTKHALNFVWSDDDKLTTAWVEANFYDEDDVLLKNKGLEAKNGLYIGMPLKALEDWNKAPISFFGFGWDYSGAVLPDSTGRLSKSNVGINLGISEMSNLDVLGDVELSSQDSSVQNLLIYINQMTYYFGEK